jgi:hypothetical protein
VYWTVKQIGKDSSPVQWALRFVERVTNCLVGCTATVDYVDVPTLFSSPSDRPTRSVRLSASADAL